MTLTLALDTSSELGVVALVDKDEVRASITARVQAQHGEALMPLLEQLFALAGTRIEDVGLLAVGLGPGSFTGVRIGLATAKGLHLARGTALVGVRTSRVLARAACGGLRVVLIDAKKNEVFASVYRAIEDGKLEPVLEDRHGAPEAVIALLRDALEGEAVTLLGSALVAHAAIFREAFPDATMLAPAWSVVRAEVLALEATEAFVTRGADDASALVPVYVRGADAKLPGQP